MMAYQSSMQSGIPKRSSLVHKDIVNGLDDVRISSKEPVFDNGVQIDNKSACNGVKKYNRSENTSESYVGFSNLPNQVYRKAVLRGFTFNLMIVGRSGLGKSTFINSLFLSDIYTSEHTGPSKRPNKTPSVQSQTVLLKENGVHLRLKLVDTPGFGDSLDNTECWKPVFDYLNCRFDDYIASESRVTRSPDDMVDERIHACIYFIDPTGHNLQNLDLEFLSRIQDRVNVIPVIAKADSLTVEECHEFKQAIMEDLRTHNIEIFEFPDPTHYNDNLSEEELAKLNRMRERVPFAVVGANTTVIGGDGKPIRARSYPWGVVEVENMEHNDFAALRYLLLTAFMQDLKDTTHNIHYENYRHAKLSAIAHQCNFSTEDGLDPMSLMDAEKRNHEQKMCKMEAEMEAVFEQKVREKNKKLQDYELDLTRRADHMREQLRVQEQEHEAARRAFDLQRTSWEETWREWDVGADIIGPFASNLGDRVMNEVTRERAKNEEKDKKKRGFF